MRDKIIQEFDIHLLSIKKDVDNFEYQIHDSFFNCFEQDIVQNGTLMVKAEVLKTHSMITINLSIDGVLKLECDRSLEIFDYPLAIENTIIFKYGEENLELDVNLFQVEENTLKLNIANPLMEIILVEVPIRKIHPKFDDSNENEDDEPYFQTGNEEEKSIAEIDPRWEKLKKLKK